MVVGRKLLMLKPEFKSLKIVFENCNTLDIPSHMVFSTWVNGIKKNIFTNQSGQYVERWVCGGAQITLSKDIYGLFTWVEMLPAYNQSECDYPKRINHSCPKKHIEEYNDITSIAYIFENGKEFSICVPWGSDPNTNLNQKTIIEKRKIIIEFNEEYEQQRKF